MFAGQQAFALEFTVLLLSDIDHELDAFVFVEPCRREQRPRARSILPDELLFVRRCAACRFELLDRTQ